MVRLAPFLFLCALAADAQPDFPFRDFSSTGGLRLVGSAQRVHNVLRLTVAERHQAGAAWFERKQTVGAGFETAFQFQLTRQGGLGPGADGFAFVLQNSGPDALGGPGSAGGFALADPLRYLKTPGIPQSIAVFFDTIRNGETHDPSGNYIAVCTAGTPKSMRWPPPRLAYTRKLPVSLKDGRVHSVRILFQPPVLSVYLDGGDVLTSAVELATVLDAQGAAYLGFTASTGNGFENHDILNWSFTRPEVSSNLYAVSSEISFLKTACLPDRNLCTPDRALIESTGPDTYHIVLPANLEWGAAIPNPSSRRVAIQNARGIACWNLQALGPQGCNGPAGNQSGAGALITRTRDGRTWFSIDDRTGNLRDNEGFFEFDVRLQ
jgi:hypothetical protein